MGKTYDSTVHQKKKPCNCCPNTTNIKFNFKLKFKSTQAASEMKKAIEEAIGEGQLISKGHFGALTPIKKQ